MRNPARAEHPLGHGFGIQLLPLVVAAVSDRHRGHDDGCCHGDAAPVCQVGAVAALGQDAPEPAQDDDSGAVEGRD